MTNLVQEMTEAKKNSVAVHFFNFTSAIANNKLPICFEGEEDILYYRERIEIYFNNFAKIVCGGKKQVLALRDEIKDSEYKNKKCLYFIDCDFDDNTNLINQDDIYITPCYSIENLYISDNCFSKILSDEFGINGDDTKYSTLFNEIKSYYKDKKNEFLKEITEFNYLIYLITIKNFSISFNNTKMSDLIEIKLNEINKKSDLQFHKKEDGFYKILGLSEEDFQKLKLELYRSEQYFSNKDLEKYFRGKNLFEFLEYFLKRLKEGKFYKETCKTKFIVNNLISTISKYAETPDCLIKFLQKHKQ